MQSLLFRRQSLVDRVLRGLDASRIVLRLARFGLADKSGTDRFGMASRPWTTLYCFPRYSIPRTLTEPWGRSSVPGIYS
jgi:hypothetical protein